MPSRYRKHAFNILCFFKVPISRSQSQEDLTVVEIKDRAVSFATYGMRLFVTYEIVRIDTPLLIKKSICMPFGCYFMYV